MKLAVLAALFQGTLAQNNLFAEFGSCDFSPCAAATSECCDFVSESGRINSFCMSPT